MRTQNRRNRVNFLHYLLFYTTALFDLFHVIFHKILIGALLCKTVSYIHETVLQSSIWIVFPFKNSRLEPYEPTGHIISK